MRSFVRNLGLGALALLVAACTTSPKITSNVNPESDFSQYKTYNFASPMGTDRNGVQTPLTSMVKVSLGQEMENRGYTLSDDPDLIVNAFVNTEQRMSVRQVPSGDPYFYGYRGGYYNTWGGYTTQVNEYTQGTLVVDLVDAKKNMLAWEAHAEQRLKSNPEPITQERVNGVVSQVMAQFNFIAAP